MVHVAIACPLLRSCTLILRLRTHAFSWLLCYADGNLTICCPVPATRPAIQQWDIRLQTARSMQESPGERSLLARSPRICLLRDFRLLVPLGDV